MAQRPLAGIILVAFGVSTPQSKATVTLFEDTVRAAFPEHPVYWAFTTRHNPKKNDTRSGEDLSLALALAKFAAMGITRIAVQPLHIIPGNEHTALAAELNVARRKYPKSLLALGKPLITSKASFPALAQAMRTAATHSNFPPSASATETFVWIGHGSPSKHTWYSDFAAYLMEQVPPILLGSLVGPPGLDQVLAIVREKGSSKVCLTPFFAMPGNHALTDMGGPASHSWQTRLEKAGIPCRVLLQSMAATNAFAVLWIDRLREALVEVNTPLP